MKLIKKRIRKQLFEENPDEETIVISRIDEESQIFWCVADNKIVVCGLLNGTANVYDIQTGALKTVLDCQSSGGFVQLSLSKDYIVSVSSYGIICIWERKYLSLIFCDDFSHCDYFHAVKILGDKIVTGDSRGLLNVFDVFDNQVKKVRTEEDETHPINHLDFDGKLVLTGSRNTIRILTIGENENTKAKKIKTGYVSCCCLTFPYAVTSGMKYNRGIKIWDLHTGKIYRTILDVYMFWSLDIRNGVLSATMSSGNPTSLQVYLVDMKSVTKEDMRIRCLPASNEPSVLDPHVCLTDTKLIEAHGTRLTMKEFWYYQVSNWELDTFLTAMKI